ncbi:recombinase family protein [Agromyces sp. GXS1127]|uniref:recombinase family protein n=1 Tax=Agromyces sp. GXS1127 TaxID=3424181 RepID=UPI003D31EF75
MRAAVYIRTSTEAQVDKQGPKVQEDSCRSYAESMGFEIVAVLHEEATTGKTDDRPRFAEALVMIEDGDADCIVFASLDRLARTLTVQEGLLARAWQIGAEVHAANFGLVPEDDPDDPMRTFIRQVMGAVAQLDRSMITARMMAGRRKKKQDGGKAEGAYPFGYSKDGPIPNELKTLKRMRELLAVDGLSYDAAARTLNEEGRLTRAGKSWSRQNLAKVATTAGITRSVA